jgi:hypothetical protein
MNIFIMGIIGLLGCTRLSGTEKLPHFSPPSSPGSSRTESRSPSPHNRHVDQLNNGDAKYSTETESIWHIFAERIKGLTVQPQLLQGGSLPSAPCQDAFQAKVKQCLLIRTPWLLGTTCVATLPHLLNYCTGRNEVLGRPLQRVISGVGCIGLLGSGCLTAAELFNAWIDLRMCNASREIVEALGNIGTILQLPGAKMQRQDIEKINDELGNIITKVDVLYQDHQRRLSDHSDRLKEHEEELKMNAEKLRTMIEKCKAYQHKTERLSGMVESHEKLLTGLKGSSETLQTDYETLVENQKKLNVEFQSFLAQSFTLMKELQSDVISLSPQLGSQVRSLQDNASLFTPRSQRRSLTTTNFTAPSPLTRTRKIKDSEQLPTKKEERKKEKDEGW